MVYLPERFRRPRRFVVRTVAAMIPSICSSKTETSFRAELCSAERRPDDLRLFVLGTFCGE
jgi:hypothetical protein